MQYRIREQKELKPSGVEWMGNIPKDLSLTRLKYLGKIKTGGKDTENKEENGMYPFFVRSDKIEKISTYSFDGEAVLTAGDGVGVGKVFHYINGKFDYHQRVYKVSDFKNLNGRYFYYYFKDNFHKEVLKLSAKSTVDSIRLPMLENFIITTPKVEIQQKIVNFLDEKSKTFDDTISKKEELITKLQDAKQSLISEVVTGKLKIIQKDGKLQTIKREKEELINSNVDWIGAIPKDWQVLQIKHYGKYQSGDFIPAEKIDKKGNFPVFGGNGLRGYTKDYNLEGRYVLIGRQGALCGNINYTEFKSWVTEHAIVVYNKKNIDVNWLGLVLEIMNLNQYSVASAQPGLSIDNITKVRSVLPKIEEQKLISKYLDEKIQIFDNTIEKTKQSIEKLKQAKEALISEAVTGKIEIL